MGVSQSREIERRFGKLDPNLPVKQAVKDKMLKFLELDLEDSLSSDFKLLVDLILAAENTQPCFELSSLSDKYTKLKTVLPVLNLKYREYQLPDNDEIMFIYNPSNEIAKRFAERPQYEEHDDMTSVCPQDRITLHDNFFEYTFLVTLEGAGEREHSFPISKCLTNKSKEIDEKATQWRQTLRKYFPQATVEVEKVFHYTPENLEKELKERLTTWKPFDEALLLRFDAEIGPYFDLYEEEKDSLIRQSLDEAANGDQTKLKENYPALYIAFVYALYRGEQLQDKILEFVKLRKC